MGSMCVTISLGEERAGGLVGRCREALLDGSAALASASGLSLRLRSSLLSLPALWRPCIQVPAARSCFAWRRTGASEPSFLSHRKGNRSDRVPGLPRALGRGHVSATTSISPGAGESAY